MQEGTGLAVMSAYVEIVFDNTDMRIPVCLSVKIIEIEEMGYCYRDRNG